MFLFALSKTLLFLVEYNVYIASKTSWYSGNFFNYSLQGVRYDYAAEKYQLIIIRTL